MRTDPRARGTGGFWCSLLLGQRARHSTWGNVLSGRRALGTACSRGSLRSDRLFAEQRLGQRVFGAACSSGSVLAGQCFSQRSVVFGRCAREAACPWSCVLAGFFSGYIRFSRFYSNSTAILQRFYNVSFAWLSFSRGVCGVDLALNAMNIFQIFSGVSGERAFLEAASSLGSVLTAQRVFWCCALAAPRGFAAARFRGSGFVAVCSRSGVLAGQRALRAACSLCSVPVWQRVRGAACFRRSVLSAQRAFRAFVHVCFA